MHRMPFAMYRKEGTSPEDFVAHYRDVHIPITRQFPGVREYDLFPVVGGDGPDAFAVMAFDTAEDFQTILDTDIFKEAIADSETFVARTETHVVERIPVVTGDVHV